MFFLEYYEHEDGEELKKENTTKYEEFVCKFDKWLPLYKQKEQAKRFEDITKKKD